MALKRGVHKKSFIHKKSGVSKGFVIALSLVSIIGFLNIVFESLFFLDFSNYIDTLWLIILGTSLILQTSIRELKAIKKKGVTSDYLGKVTMIIIGCIAIIAGLLSIPQINFEHLSFLAVKGIIGILAIVFIILQTWVSNNMD